MSHAKEQILSKHLEVERCLGSKIKVGTEVLKELKFHSRLKIVKKSYALDDESKTTINRLNAIRNDIAHKEIKSLCELNEYIKYKDNGDESDIKAFKAFSDLFSYLKKIDDLIEKIKSAKAKTNP